METDHTPATGVFRETRRHWPLMTAYERFEQLVALALSLIIAVVIVVALGQLLGIVYWLLRERDDRLGGSNTAPRGNDALETNEP